jgi:acetolactate synthase I/II/III large subunit
MGTCVEVVADFLRLAGVRRLYGVLGDGSGLDLAEAARRSRIEFVSGFSGESVLAMAAAEGKLGRIPGICVAPPGTAAGGLAGGLARARLDRTPLILFTPRPGRTTLRGGSEGDLDTLSLFEAITKGGGSITAPRAERLLAWAWSRAMQPPAGPIHLGLPADEANRPARQRGLEPPRRTAGSPSPAAIRKISRRLARGGRVVIVVGQGCRGQDARRALLDLVEHLGAPVFSTSRAKGAISEAHPLAAGVLFGGQPEQDLLAQADVLLAVGVEPVDLISGGRLGRAAILSLAEYPGEAGAYSVADEVVADLPRTLTMLREALPPAGKWGLPSWATRAGEFRTHVRRTLAEPWDGRGGPGMAPHLVARIARRVLPRDTLAVVGGGAHAPLVTACWEAYEANRYLAPGGLEADGQAIATAVAARMGLEGLPVVAFVGEAGLLAGLADLVLAAHRGIPLIVLALLDGGIGLVRALQERRRHAPVGPLLGPLDVARLGDGLDLLATEAADEAALESALRDALLAPKPAVIAVRVHAGGYRRMLDVLHGPSGR